MKSFFSEPSQKFASYLSSSILLDALYYSYLYMGLPSAELGWFSIIFVFTTAPD